MQQHPVPQNISSFEFKLIGFLTIKQFIYLAVSGIFSFIIFILPIPFLLIIILIIPFILTGLALAFFPINGVPFDKWLIIFTRSIYSPSRRIWRKETKGISFLSPWFSGYLKRPAKDHKLAVGKDRSRLESYLASLRSKEKKSHLDKSEEERLSKLDFNITIPHFRHDAFAETSEEGSSIEAGYNQVNQGQEKSRGNEVAL